MDCADEAFSEKIISYIWLICSSKTSFLKVLKSRVYCEIDFTHQTNHNTRSGKNKRTINVAKSKH